MDRLSNLAHEKHHSVSLTGAQWEHEPLPPRSSIFSCDKPLYARIISENVGDPRFSPSIDSTAKCASTNQEQPAIPMATLTCQPVARAQPPASSYQLPAAKNRELQTTSLPKGHGQTSLSRLGDASSLAHGRGATNNTGERNTRKTPAHEQYFSQASVQTRK